MCLVRAAAAASIIAGAESKNSRRWCSPMPKTSRPIRSATRSLKEFAQPRDAGDREAFVCVCRRKAVDADLHGFPSRGLLYGEAVRRLVLGC